MSEIGESVNYAEMLNNLTNTTTFTTSEAGVGFQNFEQQLQTWSYCVANVIDSCIRERMSDAPSYVLNVTATTEYLDIIYRKKPAADGPKYKALGNSMAVPVMAWIGGRIDRVHARRPDVPDAPRAVAPSVHPFQRRGPRRPPRAPATDLLTDIEQET